MGNTGNATPQFPAALPDVLAVAAVDINDARAAFSSMGPHIDVSAPGVGILSTVWDNAYGTKDGTSMASPHVAGVAALMLSCRGSLTPAQLRQIIRDTARPLKDNPADPIPNDRYGTGLVDARAAVDSACPQMRSVRIITCASSTVRCPEPSFRVVCGVSERIVCPSEAISCPISRTIRCDISQTVRCGVSQTVRCPSEPVGCGVSQTVRCPTMTVGCGSGVVCERPGRPGEPGWPGGPADVYGDDPYGTDYGDEW
jgi:hypothetical protein